MKTVDEVLDVLRIWGGLGHCFVQGDEGPRLVGCCIHCGDYCTGMTMNCSIRVYKEAQEQRGKHF